MRVALAWLLGLVVSVPLAASAGVIEVNPTVQVNDAIGVSYRFRVEAQDGGYYGKILFMAHSLYSPTTCTGASCPQHQIEALISNSSHVPQTGDCCWDGTGVRPQPPVCANYNAAPWSGLKVGAWIGDKSAPAGLWLSESVQWPRRTLGVDGSLSAFKLEATYQRNITGMEGRIHWRRGGLLPANDARDWGRSCLPTSFTARPMREWLLTVHIGQDVFHGAALFPDDEAMYLRPDRLITLATEFFEFPGVVRIFVWDTTIERETGEVVPADVWVITNRVPGVPIGLWGVRTANYAGKEVLEFGTDPQYTYQSDPGTPITLTPPPVSVPTLGIPGVFTLIVLLAWRIRHDL